ncbi:hypothetical protein XENOCAPTIV_016886, partial [Xenoophorus captivus]
NASFKATQTACGADVGAQRSELTEAEEDQSHRELSGAAALHMRPQEEALILPLAWQAALSVEEAGLGRAQIEVVAEQLKITYVTSGFLYWEEVPPMRADITSTCQSRLA